MSLDGELTMFGEPVSLLFLYFLWYSFLGWVMETCWCSVRARRFVARGFLKGPVCPIYGFGVMLMVLWLSHFTKNLLVFYGIAVISMSVWEYAVAWLLETTTHMRYWDYSDKKINLHGRICLQCSLFWGVGAYVAIYWIHPATAELFARLDTFLRQWLAVALGAALLADAAFTIRSLAMTTVFLEKAKNAHAELERRRSELAQSGKRRLEEARVQAALLQLELREKDLLADAAYYSRRFRQRYAKLGGARYEGLVQRIRREQQLLREHRTRRIANLKELRKSGKR